MYVIVRKMSNGQTVVTETSNLDAELTKILAFANPGNVRVYEIIRAFDVQQKIEYQKIPVTIVG